jgi:hypothetical protein
VSPRIFIPFFLLVWSGFPPIVCMETGKIASGIDYAVLTSELVKLGSFFSPVECSFQALNVMGFARA